MSFAALPMRAQRAFGLTRARPFSSLPLNAFLQRLSGEIGSESANLELKWMREEIRARRAAENASAISPPFHEKDYLKWELGELEKMVGRRLKGEPLQYILGRYGSTSVEPRTIVQRLQWICFPRNDKHAPPHVELSVSLCSLIAEVS